MIIKSFEFFIDKTENIYILAEEKLQIQTITILNLINVNLSFYTFLQFIK